MTLGRRAARIREPNPEGLRLTRRGPLREYTLGKGKAMPEEIEIETKELQETIEEMRDERAERLLEAKQSSWTRWISLSTALLAVVAAVAALESGSLVNEALIVKNNAVLKQSQASDQWA